MEFIAYPCFVNIISLLKFFDNALADVTEWSNVIRENLYLYWHIFSLTLIVEHHYNCFPYQKRKQHQAIAS